MGECVRRLSRGRRRSRERGRRSTRSTHRKRACRREPPAEHAPAPPADNRPRHPPPLSTPAGGVILPDSAKERPLSGTVVRCGPGRLGDDGERKAPKVGWLGWLDWPGCCEQSGGPCLRCAAVQVVCRAASATWGHLGMLRRMRFPVQLRQGDRNICLPVLWPRSHTSLAAHMPSLLPRLCRSRRATASSTSSMLATPWRRPRARSSTCCTRATSWRGSERTPPSKGGPH